ncbi:LPS assembly lipoprotein LptE [Pseudohalocynthiibacter aestuariivivens]|jgi:LPS-assembly lipoprotein|uniref:LPS assembly lipoprotein LptE n=1 Tax=Pseudohalocynthiibacter aestuariivivens TaxID=1591409 RepID=A0ABV5JDU2_9RHOB|nr:MULTISPECIES: LPS assembly lipoprotein LptE [Pseudohalocynthiibacter]MBS9718016.1 hypothetical protein [Pseudohalocynthiibacter aestuariivivens]MCK0103188.1 LPS assembly lipoprotein LptE [Pseudohalocynthiibacter sp. F2068]
MLLSDRRFFLTGLAALAGCKFQPVYGPQGPARELDGAIEVMAPSDRNSFELVRRLEQRLGQPQAPRYELSYVVTVTTDELAISSTQVINRYNLIGEINFTLREFGTENVLTSGRVDNFTGYSATGTTVSTQTAERDANDRLMVILADQIVARLLATSGAWAG